MFQVDPLSLCSPFLSPLEQALLLLQQPLLLRTQDGSRPADADVADEPASGELEVLDGIGCDAAACAP